MLKRLLFATMTAGLFVLGAGQARAQSEAPKVEIGAQFSVVRFRDIDTTDAGVGGRITYNINDVVAVEADVGDTIIRFGERNTIFGRSDGFTSHNLQFSIGLGVRF